MRRAIVIFLLCLLWIPSSAGTRRALTVFVGSYPEGSGWKGISAARDREIVLDMLLRNDFREGDITVLNDSQATHAAIGRAFTDLIRKSRQGDIVYIHFSCHGQQVTDISGDEPDGWDEALIPYDAMLSYGLGGYRGENHLLDDELNGYLSALSSKVGTAGLVVLVSDACHSGDNDRDSEEDTTTVMRGVLDRFEIPGERHPRTAQLPSGRWVRISACRDIQNNYEVEMDGVRSGRLTYAVGRSMRPGVDIASLVESIEREYLVMPTPKGRPRQLVSASVPDALVGRMIKE